MFSLSSSLLVDIKAKYAYLLEDEDVQCWFDDLAIGERRQIVIPKGGRD